MTFTEAIKELKAGRRVRSVLWHPTYFIELVESEEYEHPAIYCYSNDIDRNAIFYVSMTFDYKPCFSLKDVTSEWEYYDKPICKNKANEDRGYKWPEGTRWPKELSND